MTDNAEQAPALIADVARAVVEQATPAPKAVSAPIKPRLEAIAKTEPKPEAPNVRPSAAPPSQDVPTPKIVGPAERTVVVLPQSSAIQTQSIKEQAMSTTEEFMNFGQANVEAVIKSGQIWTTGFQDLTRTMAESAQAQFEHTVATWKALTSTKSLKEAMEIQNTRGRAALEKAVADTGRLTDASMKLAEQAIAPITARLSVATERFGRAA